jgi:resuscitation-promoting factor RpfA
MSGTLQFPSLAAMVQNFESGGNYTATNPTSSASGAYQFTTPTWSVYASQIGVDLNQYPTAASAPPAVQDAVFQQTVSQVGLQPWTCSGCDAPLSNYLVSNPGAAYLSTFDNGNVVAPTLASNATPDYGSQGDFYIDPSGSTASPNVGAGSSAAGNPAVSTAGNAATGSADVGFFPGIYGGPEETGLSPGAANTISSVGTNIGSAVTGAGGTIGGAITGVGTTLNGFFQGLLGSLENWVSRGFLIIIGLVILALALWRVLDPDGKKTQVIMSRAGEAVA